MAQSFCWHGRVSASITVGLYKPNFKPSVSKTTLSYQAALTLKDSGASIAAFCILHDISCPNMSDNQKNIFKNIPGIWGAQGQKYSRYSPRGGYQIPLAKNIPKHSKKKYSKKIFQHLRGIPGIFKIGADHISIYFGWVKFLPKGIKRTQPSSEGLQVLPPAPANIAEGQGLSMMKTGIN